MTAVDQSLVSLALHVGRTSARDLDLPALLSRICAALPAATGVAGAVMLVTEPSDAEPTVVASDGKAGWIGEAQRRSGSGPLPGVTRSGRPLRTPDLTRLGPPELATAAAESGLTSSLVVPLVAGGERYGGLQLLGSAWQPVEPAHAEAVRPLLAALVARLVDVRALRRLRAPEAPVPAPADVATTAIPAAVRAALPTAGPAAEVTQVVAVPAPRRARHRLTDEPDEGRHPRQGGPERLPVPPGGPELSRPGPRSRPR
jgi:GAF domain-containing protein